MPICGSVPYGPLMGNGCGIDGRVAKPMRGHWSPPTPAVMMCSDPRRS